VSCGFAEKDLQTLFLVAFFITSLIFLFMIYNMVKKGSKMGRKLVAKPRLCPEPYVTIEGDPYQQQQRTK
jgi:hypothetical protein